MPEENSGFKVSDRRGVAKDGDPRPERPDNKGETSGAPNAFTDNQQREQPQSPDDLPMTFQNLILSLSTTAMLQMGLLANPETGKAEKDLIGAKQSIDILQILQDKTAGNLSAEESQLLEASLYDLKMIYLQATNSIVL
jgi:hypothetical protein